MPHVYLAKNARNPGFSKKSHAKAGHEKREEIRSEIVAVGGIRHRKRKMKSPHKFPAVHSAPQSLVENVQKKHRAGKKKRCCSLCSPTKKIIFCNPCVRRRLFENRVGSRKDGSLWPMITFLSPPPLPEKKKAGTSALDGGLNW